MKKTLLILLLSNILFAQNLHWEKIDDEWDFAMGFENTKTTILPNDSVTIQIYGFKDLAKQIINKDSLFLLIKVDYRSVQSKEFIDYYKKDLYTNSEYYFKFEQKIKIYPVSIFLSDDISSKRLSEIKAYLSNYFDDTTIKYVSKEDAYELAKQDLGPAQVQMIDSNIFPASFEISLDISEENKKKMDSVNKELNNTEGVDDIRIPEFDFHIIIIQVNT